MAYITIQNRKNKGLSSYRFVFIFYNCYYEIMLENHLRDLTLLFFKSYYLVTSLVIYEVVIYEVVVPYIYIKYINT
jgi:hypothetical protein